MVIRKAKTAVLLAAVAVAVLIGLRWSQAQAPPEALREAELELREEAKHMANARRAAAEAMRAAKTGFGHEFGHDAMSKIREAAAALRDAEGEDAKADAEAKLREFLAEYFDADLTRRAAELEEIEKRVRQLRAQLEKRAGHKPDIIDLQVKVLLNEAEGLGFFSDSGAAGMIFVPGPDKFRTPRSWQLNMSPPPVEPRDLNPVRVPSDSPFAEPSEANEE